MSLSLTEGALILTAAGVDAAHCSHRDLSAGQENNGVSPVLRCAALSLPCAVYYVFYLHVFVSYPIQSMYSLSSSLVFHIFVSVVHLSSPLFCNGQVVAKL